MKKISFVVMLILIGIGAEGQERILELDKPSVEYFMRWVYEFTKDDTCYYDLMLEIRLGDGKADKKSSISISPIRYYTSAKDIYSEDAYAEILYQRKNSFLQFTILIGKITRKDLVPQPPFLNFRNIESYHSTNFYTRFYPNTKTQLLKLFESMFASIGLQ